MVVELWKRLSNMGIRHFAQFHLKMLEEGFLTQQFQSLASCKVFVIDNVTDGGIYETKIH